MRRELAGAGSPMHVIAQVVSSGAEDTRNQWIDMSCRPWRIPQPIRLLACVGCSQRWFAQNVWPEKWVRPRRGHVCAHCYAKTRRRYLTQHVMCLMRRVVPQSRPFACRGKRGLNSTHTHRGVGLCMTLMPHCVLQGLHVHRIVPVSLWTRDVGTISLGRSSLVHTGSSLSACLVT